MDYGDETHHDADSLNQKINAAIPQEHICFAIDRTLSLKHSVRVVKQSSELNLFPVQLGATLLFFACRNISGHIGNGIHSHQRDKVIPLLKQRSHDLPSAIISVSDKVKRRKTERIQKRKHLIQKSLGIPIGKDNPFMDTTCNRNGKNTLLSANQNCSCLTGVSHNVFWLCI